MTKSKRHTKTINKQKISPFNDYWGKYNYFILLTGLILLVLGYILMAQNPWDNPISLSISPIVLLIAYIVIFPLSIIIKKGRSKKNNVSSQS